MFTAKKHETVAEESRTKPQVHGFTIVESTTIDRPAGEVFALAGDYENDPLWRAGVEEMRYETPGGLRTGARTVEVMRLLGTRATTVATIVRVEPDRGTAFETRRGPVPVRGSRTFEPTGGGTEFTYELSASPDGPRRLLSPILKALLQRQVKRDLKRLKELLEGKGTETSEAPSRDQTKEADAVKKDKAQEDVNIVKAVYDAFGRGDVPAIFALFDPDAEVYQSSRLPWGGRYKGHEELGVFLTRLTGTIESEVETGGFIDDEEGHVVQNGRTRGTVRETGRRFDVPETHIWTVGDGKVLRFESYVDTAKMREALDL